MNHEHVQGRRSSAAGQTSFPAAIPRAPPLPAPRPLQRARDAASRFLGYPSRPPSPQDERESSRFAPTSGRMDRYAPLAITQNATASHKTGLEINTIAINEKGTHALIGGKEIFKTVRIEDGRCAEDYNLRAAIRKTPTHASGQPRVRYSIDIADVAWAKGDCGDFVAAATSSGKIMLYNLAHVNLQHAQLHEHFRQVHKVTFNPHKGNLLLSGSQDGTVRLWDLRDARSQASAIQSKRKFSGQSDGVRDVKWSPTEGLDFAFGTDNGELQRWDMRNLKAAKVRIPAHILACNTIDWHPDGAHIISASSDKTVRVFDVSGGRQRKASWEIKAPYPVMNARWRPSCESSMHRDHGARQCTQVVTSYDRDHAVMHIWDFRRPHLPFRVLEPYHSAPTDLLWHSQDLLWTVGREGIFRQTDVHHAPRVIDQRNLQAVTVSASGELTCVAQTRKQRRVPKPNTVPGPLSKKSSSLGASPDSSFLSRSWADDSIDHSFLRVEPAKDHGRSNSNSRVVIPTAPGRVLTIKLDDVLLNRASFRPQQYACRGRLPSFNSVEFVAYMSTECIFQLPDDMKDEQRIKHVQRIFEHNARIAEKVGNFGLCQTWKIAALWTVKHLERKLDLKTSRAAAKRASYQNRTPPTALEMLASRLAAQHLKSPASSPASLKPISNIAQHLAMPESTSNVPTPLARPTTSRKPPASTHPTLPDLDKEENIELPPSLAPVAPPSPQHPSKSSRPSHGRSVTYNRLTAVNLHEMNSLQSTDRNDMVRRWSTQPRVPLNLDPTNSLSMKIPPRLEKHDSAESFKFLEGSTDSRTSSFPASLGSAGSGNADLVAAHPSRAGPRHLLGAGLDSKGTSSGESISIAPQHMLFDGSGTLASSISKGRPSNEEENHVTQTEAEPQPEPDPTAFDAVEGPTEAPTEVSSDALAEISEEIHHAVGFEEHPEVLKRRSAMFHASAHPPAADHSRAHPHQKMAPSIISTQAISAMALNEHSMKPEPIPDEPVIDLEEGNPFTLLELLQEFLRQHTVVQPYPQMASILLLLLGPLLPPTHSVQPSTAYQTIASYVDYFLNTLNWDPEEIPSLIHDSFSHSLKAGLPPLQIEAILSTYHDQLFAHRLHNDAAHLRKLAYPSFPALYEDFLKDTTINLKCGHCHKPLTPSLSSSSHPSPLRCESCTRRPTPCTICWLSRSPFESIPPSSPSLFPDLPTEEPSAKTSPPAVPEAELRKDATLFTSCLRCGHSAHAACLDDWFHIAAGTGCPTEGCLCDCVAGAWREERARFAEKEVTAGMSAAAAVAGKVGRAGTEVSGSKASGLSSPGRVRSDEWTARESRAVEFARVALAEGDGGR